MPTPSEPIVPTPKEAADARLRRYVHEYWEEVWKGAGIPEPIPTELNLFGIELRSDGYANAHVEGQHNTEGPKCGFTTATECGERMAAAEFVECGE